MTGRRWQLALIVLAFGLAGAGQLLGEWFPLSTWPMYEAPGRHRGVVVVDGRGHPVSLVGTGWSAARLQKRLLAAAADGRAPPVASVRAALIDDARQRGRSLPDDLRLAWLAIDLVDVPGGMRVTERLGPLEDAP